MSSRLIGHASLLWILCLTACSVGPDYRAPEPRTPDAWHHALAEDLRTDEPALTDWWSALDDPVLDRLIVHALENNLELAQLASHYDAARVRWAVARGRWVPDVDGAGAAQRSRLSEETSALVFNRSRTDDFFRIGLDASWEIDFWGSVRRSVESAEATSEAALEHYRDATVVLLAEVASAYVDLRTTEQRLSIARASLTSQTESRRLADERVRAGLAPNLDLRQAEVDLATTEASLPDLERYAAETFHRLGLLLGVLPDELASLWDEGGLPSPPAHTDVGLPADLVRRRPDVRRAERELAAQTARIGVATAELYPRLSLLGSLSWDALTTHDVLDAGARAWSFGPVLHWNLFDGGRARGRVEIERLETEATLHRYEQTVLAAVHDTESAMVAYSTERARIAALERAAASAEEAVRLVRTLYTNGLTDFQNVLDSERSLLSRQDALAQSRGRFTQSWIRLYKALGGARRESNQP